MHEVVAFRVISSREKTGRVRGMSSFLICIINPIKITPSFGKAPPNTGWKASNTLGCLLQPGSCRCPCRQQIPIPSAAHLVPNDVYLSFIPTHSHLGTAYSRISLKSSARCRDGQWGHRLSAPGGHWEGPSCCACHYCPASTCPVPATGCLPLLQAQDWMGFLKTLSSPAKHTLSSALSHQKVITLRAHYDYRMCNYCLEIMHYF